MTKKILIVDDEKNIRMTLKHSLQSEKYDIYMAVNGEEALEKIAKIKMDLVLLDIKMPGLTGMEVLRKIRNRGYKSDVIMMTAYGSVEKAVEAMKLGAIDFISKPFTHEEIRTIVKEVIERNNLGKEDLEDFNDILEYSKKCILKNQYEKARKYLKLAISKEMDLPDPHNLLGILDEYDGNIDMAQKHYRAALALDPSYEPASRNLNRTIQMSYTRQGADLGGRSDENK
ncbi:response regulator [Clostridium sp. D2Q-14]|uniref:response regulator n=1 Tax=Anaeromonas gelatinilytica TaxID=2683194 RepID=UPI00193B1AA8|nr:response regulator [Anaeromonas gelatinilytica]MBS4536481.1 response regulator [Anaeromonas gelatinilytica]